MKSRMLFLIVIIGIILLLGLIIGTVALAAALLPGTGGTCGPVASSSGTQNSFNHALGVAPVLAAEDKPPPERFRKIYQAASDKFELGSDGPSILAAIHNQESGYDAGDSGGDGPMQIIESTFNAYAQDGNGDGKKDRTNLEDAVFTAAKILKEGGAPGNWEEALNVYNGGGTAGYAGMVLANSKKFPVNGSSGGTQACDDPAASGDLVKTTDEELLREFLAQENITYQNDAARSEIADGLVTDSTLQAVLSAARQPGIGNVAISAATCRGSHRNNGGLHCQGRAIDIGNAGTSNPDKLNKFFCNNKGDLKIDQLYGTGNCDLSGGQPSGDPDSSDHVHVGTFQ